MKISHLLQETGRSIGRNRTGFALATTVQAVCLSLLALFFVITLNLSAFVEAAGRRIEVHAFLDDGADAVSPGDRISRITGVAETRYVGKDSALAELRQELGEDAALVDALEENPLPSAIRITLHRGFGGTEELAGFEHKVALLPGVDEVWSGRESLARLDRILRTSVALGIAVLIIVALSIIFVAFQTAEASILTRRREIEIMELVGATRAAVRAPFLAEGTLQGLAGGGVAFLLVLGLVAVARTVLPEPMFPVGAMLAFTLALGAILGLLGALIALNRTNT